MHPTPLPHTMSTFSPILILFLTLCFHPTYSQLPTVPPFDCSISGFFPVPCPSLQTCVLFSFGNPAVDAPRLGNCQPDIVPPPPLCSVAVCAATGKDTLCRASGFEGSEPTLVATCRAWISRADIGGNRPKCPEVCTEICRIPQLVASDGSMYCNLCKLQAASCSSQFEIFGPVEMEKDMCKRPISFFDAANCCIERGIGCLGKGKRCSTAGSRIRPVPCKKGLTCVISNFGFPAADRPNSGRCRELKKRPLLCAVRRCAKKGRKEVCSVGEPMRSGIVSTCRAWAKRSDGNPGPNCDFKCKEGCVRGKRPAVLASNGRRFCNVCQLRRTSCMKAFAFFGPVKSP